MSAGSSSGSFGYVTLHGSSLSLPIYSIMALEAGDRKKAYRTFLQSLFTDLKDIHGNTHHGMHIACCGGTWQALIHGFGGVSVRDGALSLDPRLSPRWTAMRFSLAFKGKTVRVEAGRKGLRVRVAGHGRQTRLAIRVFGAARTIIPGRTHHFRAPPEGRNQRA